MKTRSILCRAALAATCVAGSASVANAATIAVFDLDAANLAILPVTTVAPAMPSAR